MKTINIIAAIYLTVVITSCANQSSPGGGPIDTAPPEITMASPENGQVNINPLASITITFDEWINQAGVSNAVSIFPPLPKGFAVKASKNRITITPKEPFSDNATYHVIIGTSVRDLRNNAIPHPINIVFSTGSELDSGTLNGSVVSLRPLIPLPRVALYWEDDDWTDAKYFSAPNYMAHTDSAGTFTFSHLREGRYRIAAFNDQYQMRRINLGDTVFTSLEKTLTVTREAQRIRLYPALSDTVIAVDSATAADTAIVDTVIIDTTIIDTAVVDTAAVDTAAAKPKDNISYRISGGANCLEPHDKRKWIFRHISRRETFISRDSLGTFSFDSIPAGKGTLLWFIDDNDDGMITPGRLAPWRSPERFFIVPDTIDAKAKWEIDGIEVRGCE